MKLLELMKTIVAGHGIDISYHQNGIMIALGRHTHPELAPEPGTLKRCLVTKVDGESGGKASKCSYVYNGWDLGTEDPNPDNRLFHRLEPIDGRMMKGKYAAPADLSYGIAIFELEWKLWLVPGEQPDPSLCNPCVG
jgi:hypothetical protein